MTDIQSSSIPPPLAWVPGFAHSMTGAIGTTVTYEVHKTVNPLVFMVRFFFGEAVSGKTMLIIWNLFQQYAAKNEAIPQGRVEQEGPSMSSKVIVRRRMGLPKDEHPAA